MMAPCSVYQQFVDKRLDVIETDFYPVIGCFLIIHYFSRKSFNFSLLFFQPQQTILTLFKPLQRGIATCMTCQNTKVLVFNFCFCNRSVL